MFIHAKANGDKYKCTINAHTHKVKTCTDVSTSGSIDLPGWAIALIVVGVLVFVGFFVFAFLA